MTSDSSAAASAYRHEQARRVVAAFFEDHAGDTHGAAEQAMHAGLEWVSLTRGGRLFREGDAGDALYLVVNGRLRVLIERDDAAPRVLNEVGRGEMVGEMAVITGQPRSATVEAIRDTDLVRLSKASFDRLVEAHPRGMMGIIRTLILRLQRQESRTTLIGGSTSFAIVPGGAGARLNELGARLAAGLAAVGPTLHMTRERLDAALGADAADMPASGVEHNRVVAWLSEQEARHRYLVYEADATDSEWTRRCIRQADRLLVVAEASGRPDLHAVERVVASAAGRVVPRQELVLLHPSGRTPCGAAAWLDARAVAAHHHVRAGAPSDFERLVRRLTGAAVGLVLGGGGARGLAQVGVIRALEEAGVPIDALGGSSVGAMVGALYAAGCPGDEILREVAAIGLTIRDPVPLLGSLLSGHATYAFLRRTLGDLRIEDLPLPCVPVSVDLTHGRVHAHRQGELARAVLASNSPPGILPPVTYDGELHVDGGLLANVPIEAVTPLVDGGPIVAVDVVPNTELRAAADYPPGVPGYAILRNRLNPFEATIGRPGFQQILNRTIEVAGAYQHRGGRLRATDLHLQPPLADFGFGDAGRGPELARRGYDHAKERIEEWKQTVGLQAWTPTTAGC